MNPLTKASLLYQIVRWRLTWNKRDTSYKPKGLSEKFITAREAADKFFDGASIASTGMAGNARCSIFFWALRERFEATGHPKHLTWTKVGAQGGRGRAPGTIEELDFPEIIDVFIGGHVETEKVQLRLADEGHIELHTMPQGEMSLIWEAMGEGAEGLESDTGIDTFLDPRVGTGSAVSPNAKHNFVEVRGDKLFYKLPKVDIAIFSAPYADSEGNIYFKGASSVTENREATAAAKGNGGMVIAAVADVIPKDPSAICIPADQVDFVVVNPRNEQTGSVPQRKHWTMLTPESKVDINDAVEQLKYINGVLKITPVRGPVENALARLAASLFTDCAKPGDIINIGVGLPEEVSRLLYESGLYKDLTFTSETGVYGGLPTPGIFFGAAINPERIEGSSWMFKLYREKLSIAVLGFLQVDSAGNVNVSKRGPRMQDYVGPGGFPNIVAGAKTVVFVGTWMAHARFAIKGDKMILEKPGTPKFMQQVDQVTFSGKQALKDGKQVYYITNVGIFKLTERGLLLHRVMPGIDIQKDIIEVSGAKVVLPEDGQVPVVDPAIITGDGFKLSWK